MQLTPQDAREKGPNYIEQAGFAALKTHAAFNALICQVATHSTPWLQ